MLFKNYVNRISNSNRIYTKPEIREMKLKDFFKKKKELLSQYDDIGLPKLDDLKSSPNVNYVEDPNEVFGGRWESVGVGVNDDGSLAQLQGVKGAGVNGGQGSFSQPQGVGVNAGTNSLDGMTGGAASLQAGEMPAQVQGLGLKTGINGGSPSKPLGLESQPQVQSTQNWGGNISQNLQQPMTTAQEGIVTGGAADVSDIVNQGIDKYLDLPPGTVQECGKLIKEFWNEGIVKNNNMNLWEEAQDFIYEKLLNNKYPMASNATIDGMRNFKAAQNQKNVNVYTDMNAITNSKYKSYLKSLGAQNGTPGVIYGEHSDVSINMANSPEMEAYITSIRDDVIKGNPLVPFKDFCYDASGKDVLSGNDDKVSRMATFRNIRMYDPKVDENGIFTCKLVDYSDFKNEPIKKIQDIPNAWGYNMQEKGVYKNYYQIINIRKRVNW